MKTFALLLALVALLVAVPIASAGDCRRATYSYAQPTYYAPTYYPPAYDQYVVVAKAVPVYINLASYTSVGDQARDYFATKEAVRLGTLEGLREWQASGGTLPAGPMLGQSPAPGIPPGAAASPAPKLSPIKTVLATRCATCHNPSEPKRVNLSCTPDMVPEVVRLKAFLMVASGEMPKGKDRIPDEELDAIAVWAKTSPATPAIPTAPTLPSLPAAPMAPATKK